MSEVKGRLNNGEIRQTHRSQSQKYNDSQTKHDVGHDISSHRSSKITIISAKEGENSVNSSRSALIRPVTGWPGLMQPIFHWNMADNCQNYRTMELG